MAPWALSQGTAMAVTSCEVACPPPGAPGHGEASCGCRKAPVHHCSQDLPEGWPQGTLCPGSSQSLRRFLRHCYQSLSRVAWWACAFPACCLWPACSPGEAGYCPGLPLPGEKQGGSCTFLRDIQANRPRGFRLPGTNTCVGGRACVWVSVRVGAHEVGGGASPSQCP